MPLFEGKLAHEVVTPDDIQDLTGIRTEDFRFEQETDAEQALNDLLTTWIDRIASHIHTRLKKELIPTDDEYEAIQDIVVRTVAKIVAVAQQQRTSPIVQINDFAVTILNTSEVIKDLDKELKPFKTRRVSFFSSLGDYEEVSTQTNDSTTYNNIE